jgi:putative membrane protein
MKEMRILFAVIILVLLFIFTVNNIQTVQLTFLGYRSELPLFLVIIISFALGFLFAALFNLIKNAQIRRQINQLQKENQAMKNERDKGTPPPQA